MKASSIFGSFAVALVASLAVFSASLLTGCSGQSSTASVASADDALWCKEHGVEEKYCVLCHPEIREEGDLLLCPEHGNIPEAICTACHPELKEQYEACPHDLPTAFCPKCSPEFAAAQESGGAGGGEHHHDHQHDHGHEEQGEKS